MRTIEADHLSSLLDSVSLISAMDEAFASDTTVPERSSFTIPVPGAQDATLLLMPSWDGSRYIGVKAATIFPSNGDLGLPSVMGTFLLLDGRTGRPLASIDGKALTALRTAATSALASKRLSRSDAHRLLMVGSGALAEPLVKFHSSVRDLDRIDVWSRNPDHANQLVSRLGEAGLPAYSTTDLRLACENADIISSATLSCDALILGEWLKPGTHVDLVGAFRPDMRESDAALILGADVYVDTREGAASEAGDLIQAAAESAWSFDRIRGDLYELSSGRAAGRQNGETRTVFKSVGCALEDLVAAKVAYERSRDGKISDLDQRR